MKEIAFIVLLLSTFTSQAQNIQATQGLTKMDNGKDAMLDGDYQKANRLFREALASIDKLPSELSYYFGRNSFHLKKYKQSIDWLNKYIELKGTNGQYSDDAIKYLELANTAYITVREKEIDDTKTQLNSDGRIDCPNDKVICPVCRGSGVVITRGTFEAKYRTCPYSGIEGILTCDEYNLYLKGELVPRNDGEY